jgi:hypothetical protein
MTQVDTGGANVLAALGRRVPTSFLWSLTLLATIGGFLFGYDTANIGSALGGGGKVGSIGGYTGMALSPCSPRPGWACSPG